MQTINLLPTPEHTETKPALTTLRERLDLRTMQRALNNQRGMTLVEVLIVLTIMASIMGVVGVFVTGALTKANIKEAQIELSNLDGMVNQYLLTTSPRRLPDTLDDLVKEKIVKDKVPLDPWGNPYVYRKVNNREYELFSMGEDGQENTEDDVKKAE